MKPNFLARNLVVNTLQEFFEKDFALGYSEKATGQAFFDMTESSIQHYDNILPLLENEINQTFFSGNIHIIKNFFDELKERRQYFLSITKDDMRYWITEWNNEWYKEYEKKVEEQTDKYFSNEKTKGLNNLDKYKDLRYVGPGFAFPGAEYNDRDWEYVDETYHAFYCIEGTLGEPWAKYFDYKVFDSYYYLLTQEVEKFVSLVSKYIARYDAGEFTQINSEETLYDKYLRKAKNNKVIVLIMFSFIIITSAYGIYDIGKKIISPKTPAVNNVEGKKTIDTTAKALEDSLIKH